MIRYSALICRKSERVISSLDKADRNVLLSCRRFLCQLIQPNNSSSAQI